MAKVSRSGSSGSKGVGAGNIGLKGKKSANRVDSPKVNNNSFLGALNEVEMEFVMEKLEEEIKDLEDMGKELVQSPNFNKLEKYKAKIKSFLQQALQKMYKIENKNGLKKFGKEQKVFVSIEQLDKKLEELTLKFMENQEEAINLIQEVEGITGLLYSVLA